jgi:hypothetical protein
MDQGMDLTQTTNKVVVVVVQTVTSNTDVMLPLRADRIKVRRWRLQERPMFAQK